MKRNLSFRADEERKLALEIAKETGTSLSYLLRLALQHGLPIAKEKLAALQPHPARKGGAR